MVYLFFSAVILFLIFRLNQDQKNRIRAKKQKIRNSFGTPGDEILAPKKKEIFRSEAMEDDRGYLIDDITWNDLGMDDIFDQLNVSRSLLGEQALYHTLRRVSTDDELLRERARMAKLLRKDPESWTELMSAFAKLGKKQAFTSGRLLEWFEAPPARLFWSDYLAVPLFLLALILLFVSPGYGIVAVFLALVFNVMTYYSVPEASAQLCGSVEQVACMVTLVEKDLKAQASVLPEDLVASLAESAAMLRRDCSGSFWIRSGNSMNGSLVDLILDYLRIITHSDHFAAYSISKKLSAHREHIRFLVDTLSEVELWLIIANAEAFLPVFCEPSFDAKQPAFRGVVHLLIPNAVPNNYDGQVSVLITGANASGKSTYLKTVCICSLLAQSLGIAPCEDYQAPHMQIITSMSLKDSIAEGCSYYMTEVLAVKRILAAADEEGPAILCALDELLKGTNTAERIAAAAQLLNAMHEKGIHVIAATHDPELTTLLSDSFSNYHFGESLVDGDVSFTYRLLPGPATTRNAIRLLVSLGVDPAIAEKAEIMAEEYTKTGFWTMR